MNFFTFFLFITISSSSLASDFSYYLNLSTSFSDDISIYSIDLENNFALDDNLFISGGMSSYMASERMEQFNNKRFFNNSLYIGAKYRLLNNYKDKSQKRVVTISNNKIIIQETKSNRNHNNNNGFYIGFNRHHNSFNNGESAYSNEYLMQYEFKNLFYKKRVKIGYKYNDLELNKKVEFNLHSITIGLSFE